MGLVVRLPPLPAAGGHPEAVDEDDGVGPAGRGTVGVGHGAGTASVMVGLLSIGLGAPGGPCDPVHGGAWQRPGRPDGLCVRGSGPCLHGRADGLREPVRRPRHASRSRPSSARLGTRRRGTSAPVAGLSGAERRAPDAAARHRDRCARGDRAAGLPRRHAGGGLAVPHRAPWRRRSTCRSRMLAVVLRPRGAAAATDASRFGLVRTARHARDGSEPMLSLAFQRRGRGEFGQLGHQQVVQGRDLMLVDTTAPYTFACATGGGSRALQVPLEQLGLPEDLVRRAAPRLRASPLHDLVRDPPRVDRRRGARALRGPRGPPRSGRRPWSSSGRWSCRRRATTRAARRSARRRCSPGCGRHVRQNLADPALDPADDRRRAQRLAAAPLQGLRRCRAGASSSGSSSSGWRTARARLSSPAGLRRSIRRDRPGLRLRQTRATSPAASGRRYGMTPREWQRAATAGD